MHHHYLYLVSDDDSGFITVAHPAGDGRTIRVPHDHPCLRLADCVSHHNNKAPDWGERILVNHSGQIRSRLVGTTYDRYLAGLLFQAWDMLVYIVNEPNIDDARHLLADTYGFKVRHTHVKPCEYR